MVDYILYNRRLLVLLNRLVPIEALLLLVSILTLVWMARRGWLSRKGPRIALLAGALVLTAAGLTKAFVRLAVSTADVPTVFEALRIARQSPWCNRLLSNGVDWGFTFEFLAPDQGCYLETPAPTLEGVGTRERLVSAVRSLLHQPIRTWKWSNVDPLILRDGLRIVRRRAIIRIESALPMLALTPLTCQPRGQFIGLYAFAFGDDLQSIPFDPDRRRPFGERKPQPEDFLVAPDRFVYAAKLKSLVRVDTGVIGGVGIHRIDMLQDNQFLCGGVGVRTELGRYRVFAFNTQLFVERVE